MERIIEVDILQKESKKNQPVRTTPREIPRINGTKPFETPRTQEQCKKHIRRDGRK